MSRQVGMRGKWPKTTQQLSTPPTSTLVALPCRRKRWTRCAERCIARRRWSGARRPRKRWRFTNRQDTARCVRAWIRFIDTPCPLPAFCFMFLSCCVLSRGVFALPPLPPSLCVLCAARVIEEAYGRRSYLLGTVWISSPSLRARLHASLTQDTQNMSFYVNCETMDNACRVVPCTSLLVPGVGVRSTLRSSFFFFPEKTS